MLHFQNACVTLDGVIEKINAMKVSSKYSHT